MHNIVLCFNFAQNATLSIKCENQDLNKNVSNYFCAYIDETVCPNTIEDQLVIQQVGDDSYSVSASFYQNNPKHYSDTNGFKLLLNLVDDYIEHKISEQNDHRFLLMHASAMLFQNKPIVFMGTTQSGKSTAILKLLHYFDNSTFISDDMVVFAREHNKLCIYPYSMPLHIRQNSLYFNHRFHTTYVERNLFFADVTCPTASTQSLNIPALFFIKHAGLNCCTEVTGIPKIHKLMGNVKYYTSSAAAKCTTFFNNIPVYELFYQDDNFLISTVEDILGFSASSKLNSLIPHAIDRLLERRHVTKIQIQGNSMLPVLAHQQLVGVEQVDDVDITINDVILYRKFAHITIHRIIDIIRDEQGIRFHTKGDNNDCSDAYEVFADEVLGRIVL